jgi:hypothetical protein
MSNLNDMPERLGKAPVLLLSLPGNDKTLIA